MTGLRSARFTGVALAAALLFALGAAPASAAFMNTGPAQCGSKEVVIASDTIGDTFHRSSAGQYWNKGYRNGGATTYTGYTNLFSVSVEASNIRSSGFRCA